MCHHAHPTPEEREGIMVLWREGRSQADIARVIGRHRSTVSRELSRNMCAKGAPNEYYRAFTAKRRYEDRREAESRSELGHWEADTVAGVASAMATERRMKSITQRRCN